MVDILQVLEGATYAAFIVGAFAAVYELRTMSRDRRTELLLRSQEFFCSREFQEATVNTVKANFEPGKCSDVDCKMIADYLECVAQMVREKAMEYRLARLLWDFEGMWEWMKPWTQSWEDRVGKGRFENFEWMANEQRRRRLAAERKVKAG